ALISAGLIYTYLYYQQQHPRDALTLYGNVDVRQVDLGFRIGGRVQTMVYEEGDLVEGGAWMAQIDQQPYLDQERQARAAVQSAQISLHNAQRLFERRQELLGDGSIAREDYENAETALKVAETTLLENKAVLGIAKTNSSDTVI